ncbi:hypothetical protein [Micromonospora endolithica]|uniref:Translation initiation factor 2 n=1 Tax=Micromonospora endolithica TaxID=230091 RepID=A0A3A9Z580_9ACTN|nr:hypothetical protein [Micromonospora endolithica]RKN43551.1 hypothetical protein D7223_21210 [Micromonospora endolithica]
MTTPGTGPDPDHYWRRPDPTSQRPTNPPQPPEGRAGPARRPGDGADGYAGPPPTTPPPVGWRPPVHVQPPPPRRLPPQDAADLDAAEQRAQRVTQGVGVAVAVVLVLLVCLLCSRLVR